MGDGKPLEFLLGGSDFNSDFNSDISKVVIWELQQVNAWDSSMKTNCIKAIQDQIVVSRNIVPRIDLPQEVTWTEKKDLQESGNWLVRFREFNCVTISDRYLLPHIDDIRWNLKNKRFFSKLDKV